MEYFSPTQILASWKKIHKEQKKAAKVPTGWKRVGRGGAKKSRNALSGGCFFWWISLDWLPLGIGGIPKVGENQYSWWKESQTTTVWMYKTLQIMGETTNLNCGAGFCSINSTSTTAVVMNLWQEKAEAYVKDTWNFGIFCLRTAYTWNM